MKKILVVLVVALMALPLSAQSVYRTGNTYIVDGQSLKKKAFAEYMQANAEANLASQFKNGLSVANAGWGLFGGGLAVEIGGLACTIASVSTTSKTLSDVANGEASETEVTKTVVKNAGAAMAGTIMWIAGSSAFTAGIICLGVGYARMHSAADIYSTIHNKKPQAYLSVKADGNGLGVALNF